MTDNTQELDEIIERTRRGMHRELGGTSPHLEAGYTRDEAKQAIIDWHNKQIDYVIGEKDESDITVLRKYLPEDEARHIRDRNYARNFLRAEQRQRAERNSLNPSKSTPFNKLKEQTNDQPR